MFRCEMNDISDAIARWLEQKRRAERTSAAVISALALAGGLAVFGLFSLLMYAVLFIACGAFVRSTLWLGLAATGLTALVFARIIKRGDDDRELGSDPMGFWILKDISSAGPRLILEGLHYLRRCGDLGELNVAACVRALAYLAAQDRAVAWQDLAKHCPVLPWLRLREQLSLLDGVLFLGDDADRVSLMDPFRLRLRWMLGWDEGRKPPQQRPESAAGPIAAIDPEKLGAYEILGLSPSASLAQVKQAYRKRMKECHPDLFAGMDQQAKDLAERWTKALNAAYSTLKARYAASRPYSPARQ